MERIENHAFHLNISETVDVTRNEIFEIPSEAFVVYSPKVFNFLSNSVAGSIYPHAFQFLAREKVDIEQNVFGFCRRHVFHHISLLKSNLRCKLILKDNLIQNFDPDALKFNETVSVSAMQIGSLNLQLSCECNLITRIDTLILVSTTSPSEKDEIDLKSMIGDVVTCQNDESVTQVRLFAHSYCKSSPGSSLGIEVIVSIAIFLVILFVLFIAGLICWQKKRRENEKKKHAHVKLTEMANSLVLAIPETRIYKETELCIEEEFTVPMEPV